MTTHLKYSIVGKTPLLVVSFSGIFSGNTNPELEGCQAEILSRLTTDQPSFIIMNFQDVTTVHGNAMPPFFRFKKALREQHGTIRLCCVDAQIRKLFLDGAVFGVQDFSDNLLLALQAVQLEK